MATIATTRTSISLRARRGVFVALAAVMAISAAFAGQASAAGGPQAYELDHRRGREVVVGNLGTYPAVVVIPGSPSGSQAWNSRQVRAHDAGVEHFQYSQVGSGDIDGDGDGDLIISAPRHSTLTQEHAGKVIVVPGGPYGPESEAAYSVDNPNLDSINFGRRLLVADLDRDGFQDVVASYETDRDPALRILWGGESALSSENSSTVNVAPGAVTSIVAANVDGDLRTELIVLYGGRARTSRLRAIAGRIQLCDPTVERAARCATPRSTGAGIAVAASGNVAGGPTSDVVLGQPRDSNGRGRLFVYRGTPSGLSDPTFVSQASPGVPGGDTVGDRFGAALAIEDLNGDGMHDAAVGSPAEERGGRVTLLYGHPDGLGRGFNTSVDQTRQDVPGGDEPGDGFGSAVSLLDVDGNGRRDLVIGAPGEDGGYGSITIIRSTSAGRPNLSTSVRLLPENVGIDEPACCGRLALGNRIGN